MIRFTIAATLCWLAISNSAFGGVLIDDFTATHRLNAGDLYPSPAKSSINGAGILGAERDAVLTRTYGVGVSMKIGVGSTPTNTLKLFNEDEYTDGVLSLTYDGDDNAADGLGQHGADTNNDVLTPYGLGGEDLTAGGTADAFVLENINYVGHTEPIHGTITVYTGSGVSAASSTRVFSIVGNSTFTGTQDGVVLFSFFSGVDFTDVGAIVVTFDTNTAPGTDFSIDAIRTRQSGGPDDIILPVPEPTSIVLLAIGIFGLAGYTIRRKRKELLSGVAA